MFNNYKNNTMMNRPELTGAIAPTNHQLSKLPKRAPMDIEFSNLTFTIQNSKKKGNKAILNGATGKFLSGQLNGIIGPSGAGKSTLTNILAGFRTSQVSGEILVNGKKRNLKTFRKISCYIMQEDYLLAFLSVEELMQSAATLKLGGGVSQATKDDTISDILEALSLTECQSTRVSNLSGGERKRLSIALELINNPPVMFFDEPTSGLDSQNSFQCISLLKRLAQEGRTIICTIHQPSARIFEMFDYLFALSEGQCIYRGTIGGLVPFLSSVALECPSFHNPADFLIEIASGAYGSYLNLLSKAANDSEYVESTTVRKKDMEPNENDKLMHDYEKGSKSNGLNGGVLLEMPLCSTLESLESSEEDTPEYAATFLVQFLVLFKRTFLSIIRDTMLTRVRFATHIVIGLFIGALFFNIGDDAGKLLSNIGCLYFSLLFLVFCGLMPTIVAFPLEVNVFVKEHLNHWYSLKAYYFAKTMADVPFQIVFAFLYVIIAYFMTSQPLEVDRFLYFLALAILISLVAQSIGLAIGAAFKIEQAVFIGAASTVPALLFSGFFVTYSAIPIYLRWLTYLSYVKYGYEAVILIIYGMGRDTLNCAEEFCMFKHPSDVLELTDVEESRLWLDFLMLFIYFLVVRGLVYFILRLKMRRER